MNKSSFGLLLFSLNCGLTTSIDLSHAATTQQVRLAQDQGTEEKNEIDCADKEEAHKPLLKYTNKSQAAEKWRREREAKCGENNKASPHGHNADSSQDDDGSGGTKDKEQKSKKGSIRLPGGLPSFEPKAFDADFEPMMDQQFGKAKLDSATRASVAAEGGGEFEFRNIPLFHGPFVLHLSSKLGALRGRSASYDLSIDSIRQASETKQHLTAVNKEIHTRSYYEIDLDLFMNWLRPTVTFGQGKIDYDHLPDSQDMHSRVYGLGVGVSLPKLLEGLLQWRQYNAFLSSEDLPVLTEKDLALWLESRLKQGEVTYNIELGIGISHLKVYEGAGLERKTKGSGVSNTLRFVSAAKFGRHFKAEAYAKYAFSASEDLENAYNSLRLPTERLNRLPIVQSAPADDFSGRVFIGAVDLIEQLTIGWATFVELKKFSSGPGATQRDQHTGPIIDYQYVF